MDNETKPYAVQRSHYVIARHERGILELLLISLEAGEEALPVFSSEELAQGFIRYRTLGPEWYVRKSYNGELISLLLGPYMGVEWVLLNLFPDPLAAQDALLNPAGRKNFIHFLLASGQNPTGSAISAPRTGNQMSPA